MMYTYICMPNANYTYCRIRIVVLNIYTVLFSFCFPILIKVLYNYYTVNIPYTYLCILVRLTMGKTRVRMTTTKTTIIREYLRRPNEVVGAARDVCSELSHHKRGREYKYPIKSVETKRTKIVFPCIKFTKKENEKFFTQEDSS